MIPPLLALFLGSAPAPAPIEAVALFDGKTLNGWVTSGGRYDGNAAWTVEDGCITGRQNEKHEGGLIYTAKPYTEFELELDCKLDYPFDSGIFLRMAPGGKGAQITLDWRPDGEIGAIYADGYLAHNPAGKERFKKDEWNHLKVRCTGKNMRIVAELNGAPLVDYTVPAEMPGFAPTGLIGLQVHGERDDPATNACRFKNLRIVDLAPESSDLFVADEKGFVRPTPWGVANNWQSLFDGKTMEGWEVAEGQSGFAVKDGLLACLVKGDAGDVRTKADYKDFELRLDFKIAKFTNSGLFLRGDRRGGDAAWTGCEVQIIDDFNWGTKFAPLKEWQVCGSLYGSVAPSVKALKPLGEWNTYEIVYRGASITTKLNGQTLYAVDTTKLSVPEGKLTFPERAKEGFIGLQRHAPDDIEGDAYAWFRNLYVRPL